MMSRDLRRRVRYEVRLRCQVFSPAGAFENLSGVTRNMSRCGLLVGLEQTDPLSRLPVAGQAARIVLELPGSAPEQRCVECRGRVVRVDRDSPSVAFEFQRFQFIGDHSAFQSTGEAVFS